MRRLLTLLATLLALLSCHEVAFAAPKCDATWLNRIPKPLGADDAAKLCSRKATLLSPATVVCSGDAGIDHYKKALEAACSHPGPDRSTAEWVKAAQFVMANGNPLGLTIVPAGDTAPIPDAIPVPPPSPEPGQSAANASISSPIAGVVAQGIADFLVSRAEAEVSLFASQEFFSKLCGDPKIAPYFPKTCLLMKDVDTGKTTIDPPSLGALRNALIKDLQTLPAQLITQLVKSAKPDAKTLGCALDVTYAVAQSMLAHEDPWQTLISTRISPPAGLYLHATAPVDCSGEWQAIENAAKVLQPADSAPQNHSAAVSLLRNGDAIGAVQKLAEVSPDAAPSEKQKLAFSRMSMPIARMFAVNNQMAFSGILNNAGIREIIESVFRAVAEALKAYECKSDACSLAVDEARDIATELTEADWSAAVVSLLTADALRGEVLKGTPKLASIFAAVAAVAEAKDSDGVQAALESFAAPVGSWRRKHESSGIGILGLAGANLSQEFVLNSSSRGGTVTPTLSLGFDMYFPSDLFVFAPGTFRLGFQVPVIDVGNFASVRYDPDSDKDVVHAKTTPDITVSQLFAPGLYAFTSLGKSPFVLSGGCSWIPALRTVTDDGVTSQHSVVRCGGSLSVDVTIMPLLKF